ncbi:hypothetical protein T01_3504, partial [Trichinella spiralis]
MKLVPLATLVHMDIKAFPSRPSVPLLITNSIVYQSFLWIMSSHEARTDANQCSPGVSMAFSTRPSVPLLITNSKMEFHIMTAMKYQWITSSETLFSCSRWHSQIAFFTVLMFFLVTQ